VPLTSATPSSKSQHKHSSVHEIPGKWSHVGCWSDNSSQPTLTSMSFSDSLQMMIGPCVNFCNDRSHLYAGLENGTNCHCGDLLTVNSKAEPSSDCNIKCGGDSKETCGGNERLDLWWSGSPPPPQPTIVPVVKSWTAQGCFSDSNDDRTLSVRSSLNDYTNTVENCIAACKAEDYPMAGMEFAGECWCGNVLNPAKKLDPKYCMLSCPGDAHENCGGAHALVIYVSPVFVSP